jgi:hypothetical protein
MGSDSVSAAVVVCTSVVVIAFNISWLTCAKRQHFPPYGDRDATGQNPPAYLKLSAVFAGAATLVLVVVLPLYAYYIEEFAFTALVLVFLTLEMLWIPAVYTNSVLLTQCVLFTAASALTAALVVGVKHYTTTTTATTECVDAAGLVYFVLGMIFPLGNVWLNDLVYFTYMWQQCRNGGASRHGTFRSLNNFNYS